MSVLQENRRQGFMRKRIKTFLYALLPAVVTLAAIAVDMLVPDLIRQGGQPIKPYFVYFMLCVTAVFFVCAVISAVSEAYRNRYIPKVKFYIALMFVCGVVNFITSKTDLLPIIYFPSWDAIFETFIQYSKILRESLIESSKLYLMGILCGGFFGVLIGTGIGWSKRMNYWVFPVIRFIGPIPTSVWVPFAIFFFPTLGAASIFIIALSMAFPIIVLTSSGIQNIPKEHFEVGSILGAKPLYQIIHIAIPAALPQIFVGMFNGVTLAFMSLMVAELIGVQAGIGWFINWQQRVMAFPSVYSALLLLALMCFVVMKVLFWFRKKFLSWQEGSIRW